MALNPRMAFLCTLCIVISGFLASYKAFQIHREQLLSHRVDLSENISRLVGENIGQKIQQMEATVSYLDQSTIETLKRLGARYFAYAYQDKGQDEGQWAFKWKILGSVGKEAILKEITPLPYSQFELTRRYWQPTPPPKSKKKKSQRNSKKDLKKDLKRDLIFVSPAVLAKSLRLQEGFLIFGLTTDFFKFAQSSDKFDGFYGLFNTEMDEIFTSSAQGDLTRENSTDDANGANGIDTEFIDPTQDRASVVHHHEQGKASVATAVFSPVAQLWVTRSQRVTAARFISSRFFSYFLLTTLLALLVMMLLLGYSPWWKIAGPSILAHLFSRRIFSKQPLFARENGVQPSDVKHDGGSIMRPDDTISHVTTSDHTTPDGSHPPRRPIDLDAFDGAFHGIFNEVFWGEV